MLYAFIWAAIGFLLGLCFIIVVPWTAARIAGRDWIEAVSNKYIWFAQTAARRSALIVRDGDVTLVPKRYDSDLKADKDSSTGDKRHHRDDFDVIGRLSNKVFGIGLTSRDAYISPLLAELGEAAKRAKETKEIGPTEVSGTNDKFVDGIHIPKRSQLVDLSAARYLTTGSSEPESGQEAYKKTKISQEKFHEKVSFGQGMLIILAAVGSMGVAWFGASRGGSSPNTSAVNETTLSLLALLAVPYIEQVKIDVPWSKIAAWLYIGVWVIGIPLIAAVTYGIGYAALVIVLMVVTAVGLAGFIALFGPSMPVAIGMALASGFWILAQLTVGRGVLVERDTGELEHRMLSKAPADADHDFETVLSDGKVLPIDGSKGDLIRFAWAPIGAVAEKSVENMDSISEDIPGEAATDGGTVLPDNLRMDYQPEHRVADDDHWLVTLPHLWPLCEDTAESQAVRQGRQKALTEHGGEQQISMLVFFGMLLGAVAIGGLIGLIAGGAIL